MTTMNSVTLRLSAPFGNFDSLEGVAMTTRSTLVILIGWILVGTHARMTGVCSAAKTDPADNPCVLGLFARVLLWSKRRLLGYPTI